MTPVEKLLEAENLRYLKARYFRFWDSKHFDRWLDLFVPDATFEVDLSQVRGPDAPRFTAKKADFADTLIALNRHSRTVHRGHTPEFDISSPFAANGIWSMDDIIERDGNVHIGHGYYHESYRKIDGNWRFVTVKLVRTRMTMLPEA